VLLHRNYHLSALEAYSIYITHFVSIFAIIVAVTEGPVREEQLLHDLCLLGAVTVEITQILTRAGFTFDVSISEPL
jgi:hypothetical protein